MSAHLITVAHKTAILTAQSLVQEDGWRMLMPAGFFRAIDGRPFELTQGWYIDESIANRLIAQLRDRGQDIVVDYEHQTLKAEENGKPAPAAGWVGADDARWTEQGFWVKPKWTETAAAMIVAGEYRFLSAVFSYDGLTGHLLELHSIALTNDSALTGMSELTDIAALKFAAAKPRQHKGNQMNDELLALLTALGITIAKDADDTTIKTALTNAKNAITALQSTQQTSLTQGSVDLTKWVPVETYEALRAEVMNLSAENSDLSIDQMITDAKKEGRVIAAEEAYLKQLGKQAGVASLKAVIDARSPIASLTQKQTDNIPQGARTASLTAEQKEAAKLLGRSDEEYLKLLS